MISHQLSELEEKSLKPRSGPIWIEGGELHYVNASGLHWKWKGHDLGLSQSRKGAVGVQGGSLVYVDAKGHKRRIPGLSPEIRSGMSVGVGAEVIPARTPVMPAHGDKAHGDKFVDWTHNDFADMATVRPVTASNRQAEWSLLALLDALTCQSQTPALRAHKDSHGPHGDHVDEPKYPHGDSGHSDSPR